MTPISRGFGAALTLATFVSLCGACSGSPVKPDDVSTVAASVDNFRVVHTADDFYEPEMRIAATGGGAVTVISASFAVPGLPNLSCAPVEPFRIGAGSRQDVFMSFGYSTDGDRATADTGRVFVRVRDDSGASSTITATGPVVSDNSPGTQREETDIEFRCT